MNLQIPVDPEKDYLNMYGEQLDAEGIHRERAIRNEWFGWKGNRPYWDLFERAPLLTTDYTDFSGPAPIIGKRDELTDVQFEGFKEALEDLRPWRKGPMELFGIDVDAEWRSDFKWQRVMNFLEEKGISLQNKRIADIGCNNGYYMFRMLQHDPRLVIGFDPTMRYFMQFYFLNRMIKNSPLHFELLGGEDMPLYPKFFDMVFCMGILYHNVNPLGMLRGIYKSMAKDGVLIVESQGIPGEMPVALFPEDRYAKVRGTYFVPTVSCLVNWLTKANFKDIEVFHVHKLDNSEQRRTDWMRWESLDDFLDPENPEQTIEGYPAPLRIYVKAVRK